MVIATAQRFPNRSFVASRNKIGSAKFNSADRTTAPVTGGNDGSQPELDIRATHSDSHAANAKGSVDFPISSDQATQFQAGFMQH